MNIEIFRAGTHRDNGGETLSFGNAEVAAIADGYDASVHQAPIVVGHPQTDDPAYGWIKGLKVLDGVLVADAERIDPQFAEAVRAGRYTNVSASFYKPGSAANPTPDHYYLRHVGFLGAKAPAVKGLKPVELADGDDGIVTVEFSEHRIDRGLARILGGLRDLLSPAAAFAEPDKGMAGDGTGAAARAEIKRLTDAGMTLEAVSDALAAQGDNASRSPGVLSQIRDGAIANPPDSLIAALKKISAPDTADPDTTDNAEQEDTLSDSEKERLKKLENENKALKAKNAEFAAAEEKARQKEDRELVEGLIKDGRLAPGVKDDVIAFMQGLEATDTVDFSEGKSKTPRQFFREFLDKAGTVIDFSERSAADGEDGGGKGKSLTDVQREHHGLKKGD